MSARIIRAHVNEGLRLAHENGLPKIVSDFIPMHHGTTRVEYFYRQALEIDNARPTSINQMSYKDAIKAGALAFFDEKYEDDVRVLNIGTKSMELCGGTHVDNTNEIKMFKILKSWEMSD